MRRTFSVSGQPSRAPAHLIHRFLSRNTQWGRADSPPMPPTSAAVGHLQHLADEPLDAFLRWSSQYGDYVALQGMGDDFLLVIAPEGIQRVLQANAKNYDKGTPSYDKMRLLFRRGLVTNEGASWLAQRRIIQPAFHRARIAALVSTMAAATAAALDRMESAAARGLTVDARSAMASLALRITSETLLGRDLSGESDAVAAALSFLSHNVEARITRLIDLPLWVPSPENMRFNREVAKVDRLLRDVIAERRRGGSSHNDLLAMLLDARDEDTGAAMSDDQLRDEAVTIFVGGHETTSSALAWALHLLAAHPEAMRSLRREVDTVLGGRQPTADDLATLPYTRWTVQETMRLYPPSWLLERRALERDVIGGYTVEPGTQIFVSQWATHRSERHWERPDAFDPERFSPARSDGRHPYAYFPFGAGPRQCIGNVFAMSEAMLVLAMFVQRFTHESAGGTPVWPDIAITLQPAPGVPLTLTRRGGAF